MRLFGNIAIAASSREALRAMALRLADRSTARPRQPVHARQSQTRRQRPTSGQASTDRSARSDRDPAERTSSGLLAGLGIPTPKSWGLLCLRGALATTFFWSGFAKLWPGSPETVVITSTVSVVPQPEFVVLVGFVEALIGLLLLYRPLLRIATLLTLVQLPFSQLLLLFEPRGGSAVDIPGAWVTFPVVPSEFGSYVLHEYVLVTGVIVVAIGYTGPQIRKPPLARLRSETVRHGSVLLYRAISEWLPRHALTFLRAAAVCSLVGGGALTMLGHGTPLANVRGALAALGVELAVSSLVFVVGGLQLWAGTLLISDDQGLLELAVLLTAIYAGLGILPLFVLPEAAYYGEYTWLSPAFESLYFLTELVVLGAVWTIRDARVPWEPARGLYLIEDAIEVLLAWLGIGARNAPNQPESDEIRRYRK
jgi:hypothetical protein